MNKQAWKESLTDLIVDKIFTDYPNFDPTVYRKRLNPVTGQISDDSDVGNTVLYQQDYQNYGSVFDSFLETVSTCFCISGNIVHTTADGEYICEGDDYNEVDSATSIQWVNGAGEDIIDLDGYEDWILMVGGEIYGCGSVNDNSTPDDPADDYTDGYILYVDDTVLTFISQFVGFSRTTQDIDGDKAREILDVIYYSHKYEKLMKEYLNVNNA